MIYLALHSDSKSRTGIKEIASSLDIPAPFLAKILQLLTRHKILVSSKGPNGGFALGRNAREITLYDIITVIDGQDIFDTCLISMRACHEEEKPCPVHHKYEPIRHNLKQFFQQQDIGSLAEDIKSGGQSFVL